MIKLTAEDDEDIWINPKYIRFITGPSSIEFDMRGIQCRIYMVGKILYTKLTPEEVLRLIPATE